MVFPRFQILLLLGLLSLGWAGLLFPPPRPLTWQSDLGSVDESLSIWRPVYFQRRPETRLNLLDEGGRLELDFPHWGPANPGANFVFSLTNPGALSTDSSRGLAEPLEAFHAVAFGVAALGILLLSLLTWHWCRISRVGRPGLKLALLASLLGALPAGLGPPQFWWHIRHFPTLWMWLYLPFFLFAWEVWIRPGRRRLGTVFRFLFLVGATWLLFTSGDWQTGLIVVPGWPLLRHGLSPPAVFSQKTGQGGPGIPLVLGAVAAFLIVLAMVLLSHQDFLANLNMTVRGMELGSGFHSMGQMDIRHWPAIFHPGSAEDFAGQGLLSLPEQEKKAFSLVAARGGLLFLGLLPVFSLILIWRDPSRRKWLRLLAWVGLWTLVFWPGWPDLWSGLGLPPVRIWSRAWFLAVLLVWLEVLRFAGLSVTASFRRGGGRDSSVYWLLLVLGLQGLWAATHAARLRAGYTDTNKGRWTEDRLRAAENRYQGILAKIAPRTPWKIIRLPEEWFSQRTSGDPANGGGQNTPTLFPIGATYEGWTLGRSNLFSYDRVPSREYVHLLADLNPRFLIREKAGPPGPEPLSPVTGVGKKSPVTALNWLSFLDSNWLNSRTSRILAAANYRIFLLPPGPGTRLRQAIGERLTQLGWTLSKIPWTDDSYLSVYRAPESPSGGENPPTEITKGSTGENALPPDCPGKWTSWHSHRLVFQFGTSAPGVPCRIDWPFFRVVNSWSDFLRVHSEGRPIAGKWQRIAPRQAGLSGLISTFVLPSPGELRGRPVRFDVRPDESGDQ